MANTTDLARTRESVALVPSQPSDDPDVIRQQIDHTRAQMAETINALGERLSPENLIEQAKTSAKEATVGRFKDMTHEANRRMEGMSNSLSHTIRENPLPVAVIGLGLGWLLLSERGKRDDYRSSGYSTDAYRYRSEGYRYYDDPYQGGRIDQARERMGDVADTVGNKAAEVKNRVGDTAQNIGESVSEATSRAGESVSQTAHRVGESVSEKVYRAGESVGDTAEMVQERAGDAALRARREAERLAREAQWRSQAVATRTKQSFWGTMEENPLAIGAVLAIAGAAVGAAIPASEYENRLMGETRDRLMDEAKVRAQDAVERVQTVVEETQKAAVTEAKDAAQRQNLTIDSMKEGGENGF
jgi:hypothetical protein